MAQLFINIWFWLGRQTPVVYGVFARTLSGLFACLVWLFGRERRTVALTNLRLCFPEWSAAKRGRFTLWNMFLYLKSFFDRAWLWQATSDELKQRIHLTGIEHLHQAQKKGAVILLSPHFFGLDAGWTRLCMEIDMVTMYSPQKSKVMDTILRNGREHMGNPILLSRQEGVRGIVKAMKAKRPLYYLPDMDFGDKDSVFVPFFGVSAATVTAVARLSRLLGAQVLFCPTWMVGDQYHTEIFPALDNFPADMDDTAATTVINQYIEQLVLRHPEQYLWLHKRFKTRPPGQARYY